MSTLTAQGRSFLPYYILILLLSIFFYFKMFNAGFISWDDSDVLLKNNDVHQFNIKAFFTKHYVGNYAPFTMLSFAIDWALFHGDPFWHHFINIFLHGINGILVFFLTYSLFQNRHWALLTALVFCLHPLQVETVAWVAAKNNIVYSLFFLASLIFYAKYLREMKRKELFWSLLLFILSALSKPSAICLPFCLLAIDLIQKREFNRKLFIEKIPFLLVTIILGIVTIMARREDNFLNSTHAFAWYERIGYAGHALFCYVSSFLAPVHQSVIYPYPQNKTTAIISGYAVWLLFAVLIFLLVRSKRYQVAGIIFFFIFNLILVLQFLPFGEVLTADRYMYIPIIALCWLILIVLKPSQVITKYAAIAFTLVLGALTILRSQVWKSSIELYSDILKKYPYSTVALNSLGAEYMTRNDDNKALAYFNDAIRLSADNYKAYYNRGLLFVKNNRHGEAIHDFSKAIRIKNYTKAYAARADVYAKEKEFTKAIADAEAALNKDPNNTVANYVLANTYSDLNRLDKAMEYYNKAIAVNPTEATFYFRRAIVHGKQQHFDKCLSDLNTCTGLDPNFAEAFYWKGVAKVNLKQDPCEDLKKAVDLGFTEAKGPLLKYCKL